MMAPTLTLLLLAISLIESSTFTIRPLSVRISTLAERDVDQTAGGEGATGHEVELGIAQLDRLEKHFGHRLSPSLRDE